MNALKLALCSGGILLFGLAANAQEPAKQQLKQGDMAPAFELKDQNGKTMALGDFKGKKLLLYFYPKADTPGCTAQACSIRDAMPDLGKLSLAAAGVSPDLPEAQTKFAAHHALSFPLLSDPDHKSAEAYGVWGMRKMGEKTAMGISRSAFLIDESGKLAGVWYNVKPEDTIPNALDALKRLGAKTP